MRHFQSPALPCVLIVLHLTFISCESAAKEGAAAEPSPDSAELASIVPHKVAEVFAALHPAALKDKRWVRIDIGPVGWESSVEGWLIEEGPASVFILDSDGSSYSLRKPRPNEARPKVKDGQRIGWDELHSSRYRAAWEIRTELFPAYCKPFLLKGIPEPKGRADGVFGFLADRSALESVVIDACRYACWAEQVGEKDLAGRLLYLAKKAHVKYAKMYIAEDAENLHRLVANKLASGYRSSAVSATHHGTPRPEILAIWEKLARIPYHQHAQEATRMVQGCKALIAEDRAWKEPRPEALAKMTAEQKVTYWLYHLRDADVYQTSDPGSCYVVSDHPFLSSRRSKNKPNPAVELKKLGMAAIPQLIAHLDDTRPTRCQGHWRSYDPSSYYLLCYADCCQQIFESITGITIFEGSTTVSSPVNDGKGKACRARAERWWQEYQRKGEKQMLIEGTARGNRDSSRQAERLVEKYPEAAFDAITQGIRKSSEGWIRSNLLAYLCTLKDRRVSDFLLQELKGPVLQARVHAAGELSSRGRPEGLEALVAEWKKLQAEDYGWGGFDAREAVNNLVGLLLIAGKVETIDVLRTDLRKRSLYLRWHVIETVGKSEKNAEKKLPEAMRKAVDRLLVEAFADTEECRIRSFQWQGKRIEVAAVGDFAATLLAERWGKPTAFDPTADFRTRRSQKIALANLWRKENGHSLLPEPPSLKIIPAPDAKTAPLLAVVTKNAERAAALASLEALGLPALPAVKKLLASLPKDHHARKDLQDLSARLRSIVQEVSFAPDSIAPTMELRRRFQAWEGKCVTPPALLDAILSMQDRLPANAFGIHIALEHPGDDTGVTMIVTLAEKRPLSSVGGDSKNWQCEQQVRLVGKQIQAKTHGHYRAFQPADLEEFVVALKKVLIAPPEESFTVRLGVAVDRK